MRSNIFSLSPLLTFAPLLLSLSHDHGALAQCSRTWTLPSDGLTADAYQVLGGCRRRSGIVGFAWETIGLDDDEYEIILKRGKDEKEYAKEFKGAASGSSHEIHRGSGEYHVVFQCREKGGVFPHKCERGTLKFKIVNCDCPANMIKTGACNYSDYQKAKDVQCVSPPTNLPTPFRKPYIFEYEIKDFTFDPPTQVTSIETEKVSTSTNGIIKNCADGVTAKQGLELAFSVKNSQSMTVSKSFTSSNMQEVAAGFSLTVEAEAGAIFASTSVAATANFEAKTSWGESATEEESKMIEETSEISFTLSTEVEVEPNTCSKYTLLSNVSTEPVNVPYTAKVYLTVFHNDGIIDDQDKDKEQVRDEETLTSIRDKLTEYDATIDMSSNKIVYEIEGVYSGLYASSAHTETSNCDLCPSTSEPAPAPIEEIETCKKLLSAAPAPYRKEPKSSSSSPTGSLIDGYLRHRMHLPV